MNVIIANEARDMLSQLNIDVIKSVTGVHSADEIVEMFRNFFFARMILDITAIENYNDIQVGDVFETYKEVAKQRTF